MLSKCNSLHSVLISGRFAAVRKDDHSSLGGGEGNEHTYTTCVGGSRTAWPRGDTERQVEAIWLALGV